MGLPDLGARGVVLQDLEHFRRRVLSAPPESDRGKLVQLAADDLDVAALELTHLEQLGVGGTPPGAGRGGRGS